MPDKRLEELKAHMNKTIMNYEHELMKLRTGRANPAMVEDVKVDYYGTPTPLKHLAHITTPEPDSIVIRPYDKSQMQAVQKAIQAANLGFNPAVESEIVRIKVPRLTEERRQELTKHIKEKGEDSKVALRNIRRDLKERLEREKKDGRLAEDDFNHLIKEMDKITHDLTAKIDQMAQTKEKQLMTM
jgi:ribosome recycling factor